MIKNSDLNDVKVLWEKLNDHTQKIKIEYLNDSEVVGSFASIRCPKASVVHICNQNLHANLIKLSSCKRLFIATQAPCPKTFELFWHSALLNVGWIVDLTMKKNIIENERNSMLFYYPDAIGGQQQHGSIVVKLLEKNNSEKFSTFNYQVMNSNKKCQKEIFRLHYNRWKDFSAIPLEDLKSLIKALEAIPVEEHICVHCKAGVGRTGTLISAYFLKDKILRGEIDLRNLDDALIDLILTLRVQRGEHFVETIEQFNLLRNFGREYLF